jgi:uncharacterized membrane protein YeaQ/YmgE (transglycosylase-associated protein family)
MTWLAWIAVGVIAGALARIATYRRGTRGAVGLLDCALMGTAGALIGGSLALIGGALLSLIGTSFAHGLVGATTGAAAGLGAFQRLGRRLDNAAVSASD